jgi:choline kinase
MGGRTPKALIPVRNGEALIDHLLRALETAGIHDVLVVTGFRSDAVEEHVTEHAGPLSVAFTRNARYASWGNFHSVRMALDASPGADVLVVNSDIVVPAGVLGETARGPGDLVLAVQRRSRLDLEDMRVELDRDRIAGIGKDIKMVRSHGEFCGVSLLRPPAARLYGDIATELEWRATTSLYYEDVYARMLSQVDARATFVESGAYAEVDTPDDLEGARHVLENIRHAGAAPA